jgi:hypothetical protein
MNERPQDLGKGTAIEKLLDEAFPDLKCLRCGNDAFALTYDIESEFGAAASRAIAAAATGLRGDEIENLENEVLREVLDRAFITLVCERCGMIERHLRPTLERSEKPIKIELGRR